MIVLYLYRELHLYLFCENLLKRKTIESMLMDGHYHVQLLAKVLRIQSVLSHPKVQFLHILLLFLVVGLLVHRKR